MKTSILYKLLGRAQNSGGEKLCRILFQSFGEENVGEFAIVCQFIESGIWLGKILAKDVCFASFPQPEFCAIRYLYTFSVPCSLESPLATSHHQATH